MKKIVKLKTAKDSIKGYLAEEAKIPVGIKGNARGFYIDNANYIPRKLLGQVVHDYLKMQKLLKKEGYKFLQEEVEIRKLPKGDTPNFLKRKREKKSKKRLKRRRLSK